VQQALLKMLEGTVANVPPQGGPQASRAAVHPDGHDEHPVHLRRDVRRLEDIISRRLGKRTIGFGAGDTTKVDINRDRTGALLKYACTDDVIEYGLIPELVGRLPVVSSLAPLMEADLVRILAEPKNSLVKQYQKFFQMENATLEFTEGALYEIAKIAIEKDTGARGLRSVVEEAMFEVMYELPDLEPGKKYVLTPEVVRGEQRLMPSTDSAAA
jgi:ATP-dependent Clp protease ATP-binding subunit ClpX